MIKPISSLELKEILMSHCQIDVDIDEDFKYYEIKNNYFHSIVSCRNIDETEILLLESAMNFVSFGVPILLIENMQYLLAPPILDFVNSGRHIQISKEQINRVTRGSSVNLKTDSGTVIVVDQHRRKIAIGKVLSGKFTPVVDVGWYLRAEK